MGTPAAFAAAAAARLTLSGTSRCSSITAAPLAARTIVDTSSSSFSGHAELAPPTTTDDASPPGESMTRPVPEGRSGWRPLRETSTPFATSSCSSIDACESPPNWPTNLTGLEPATRRAAATAWFAPLPPTATLTRGSVAVTVSSNAGGLATFTVKSTFTDPTTTMCGGGASHDGCSAANDTSGDAIRIMTAIAVYTVRVNTRHVAMLIRRVDEWMNAFRWRRRHIVKS